MRLIPARSLGALVSLVVVQPLLSVLHETLTLIVAALWSAFVNFGVMGWLLGKLVPSPVYARLMQESAGNIRTEGLAISGEIGRQLHAGLPALFLKPELAAPGVWVSAVLHRSSTVLGILITRALVEVLLIILGTWLLRAGMRRRTLGQALQEGGTRDWFAIGLGLYVQAQSIGTLFHLTLSPTFSRLEDTGIGFALSILLRLDPAHYDWFMKVALPLAIPALLTAIGLGLGWTPGLLIGRVMSSAQGAQAFSLPVWKSIAPVAIPVAFGLVAVLASPLSNGYFGLAKTHLVAVNKTPRIPPKPTVLALAVASSPTAWPTPTLTPSIVGTATATPSPTGLVSMATAMVMPPKVQATGTPQATALPTGPSLVTLRRTASGSVLVVNGRDVVVNGINYNVNYTGLPEEVKKSRHRKDFRILRDAGVNSVIGWGVYDQVTLDMGAESGIGVVMPFELDPQGPYENKAFREQVKSDFLVYVQRYKNSPAVWAWNPGGDELLHRMDTEQHRTPDKLQEAADFLVELSAAAFQADPNHVSIVKEPRDWYIPYLDQAIRKVRTDPTRPNPSRYLVYAVNVYGHPAEILNAIQIAKLNSDERMKIGFLVGEYAPFGLPRADRAINFALIADDVYQTSPMGGYVYVYGPDQPNPQAPNPYDPLRLLVNEFSLLDIEDNPVDEAFAALSMKWFQVKEQVPKATPTEISH